MSKKKLLEKMLRFMARMVLRKYHPLIIGVTGSVGKSLTKEAVALVVSRAYVTRKTEGNDNNEIGVPLTIIGVSSVDGSLFRLALIFFRWLWMMMYPTRYPEVLVLEMGIDRPGDMDYLLEFVPVKIGVVTGVSASHLAFFGTIANIAKEKGKLVASLPEDGYAILSADDKRVEKMREKASAKTITYGFDTEAMIRVDHLLFHRDAKRVEGFSFKLNYNGKTIPVRLPKLVARHHIAAALAGAGVAVALKMNLVEIAEALENFEPLSGRLRLLPGKEGIILLDDTYNASPVSVVAALDVVKDLVAPRKVLIVGDMLELGANTKQEHMALATAVLEAGAHIVVTVGEHMRSLFDELSTLGFSHKQMFWFPDPLSVLQNLENIVRAEDLILIKGSQSMRMEKITEALLVDPREAKTLLCRQSRVWQDRPFVPPAEWTSEV
ncbi:MAG: UDP-N-acetylmuramoyl-tripeptide--D-alanyl-D-alanine ligase [Candidatus Moranbacteria bacterium]|nr:UDP-N-acetylmuramoyl-tripeptide--D-alanyl-D-alanine ligase [Candidatus Moranbacteria bacterium]